MLGYNTCVQDVVTAQCGVLGVLQDAMLREFQEEITRLKAQLAARKASKVGAQPGISLAKMRLRLVNCEATARFVSHV